MKTLKYLFLSLFFVVCYFHLDSFKTYNNSTINLNDQSNIWTFFLLFLLKQKKNKEESSVTQ
jgi:hypothetical protein